MNHIQFLNAHCLNRMENWSTKKFKNFHPTYLQMFYLVL